MRALAPLLLLAPLVACTAGSSDYPSLAPRPIEQVRADAPEPPPPAAAPADPALAQRYAAIVAQAGAADEAFQAERARTEVAAARAVRAAVGSEAWTDAQLALTRLEAKRAGVGRALADLDAERSSGVFDAAALDAAVARVGTIDAEERAALARIARSLPGA